MKTRIVPAAELSSRSLLASDYMPANEEEKEKFLIEYVHTACTELKEDHAFTTALEIYDVVYELGLVLIETPASKQRDAVLHARELIVQALDTLGEAYLDEEEEDNHDDAEEQG